MKSLNRAIFFFLLLLSQVKLLCTGQLFPTNGNPNGRLPENVLDSIRASYRNGNLAGGPGYNSMNLQQPPPLYSTGVRSGDNVGLTLPPGSGFTRGNPSSQEGVLIGSSHLPPENGYAFSAVDGAGHLMTNSYQYHNNRYKASAPPSNSKSISGDYCFEPLLSCDTTNTVLYCIQGRCTCPTQWTLSPGSLPLSTVWHPEQRRCVSVVGSGCHTITSYPNPGGIGLGTARGSSYYQNPISTSSSALGDQSSTTGQSPTKEIASSIIKGIMGLPTGSGGNGYVYCQPGVQCVRHPGYQEVGICAACGIKSHLSILMTLMVFHQILRLC